MTAQDFVARLGLMPVGVVHAQDVASECFDKAVVNQTDLNLFAAALHAAVSAGKADAGLWKLFCETFRAEAGQFIGA